MTGDCENTTLAGVATDVSYGYTESASDERVGPRFLRITDIQNGVVDWHKVPYCPISESNHRKYRLHYGDIVVARTGNSTGENYLYRGSEDAVYASYLIRFRVDQRTADPAFVWYNLRTQRWQDFIGSSKTGSAQAGANAKVLGGFPLTLPPLPEQRTIAAVRGTLDDKIELNRRMNATLEAMARALFQSWFVDFDPVRAKLDGRLPPGMDAATAALFPGTFQDSSLGPIPYGWEVARLDNIASVLMGLSPKGDSYNSEGVGIPLINGPVEFGDYFPVKSKWTEAATRFAAARDLIFCVRGSTTGRRVVSDGEYGIGRGVCAIRATGGFHSFLYQTVTVGLDRLLEKATGSVFPSLSAPDIKGFSVLKPSTGVLDTYERTTGPLIERIQQNHHQSRTLATLRDTLLPKLLSGELSVRSASAAVDAAA